MSDIWVFSPSVENHLRQCLSAKSQAGHNKWAKEFSHLLVDNHSLVTNIECNNTCRKELQNDKINSSPNINAKSEEPIILTDDDESINNNKQKRNSNYSSLDKTQFEELLELIETELDDNFDIISEKCINNTDIFVHIAKHISFSAFEKLCKRLYSNETPNKLTKNFFQHFLPTFLKREYNCVALDLVLKGSRLFPLEFDAFIMTILNDTELSNKVLQDCTGSLDRKGKTKFLETISHIDMKPDLFQHHLYTIHIAYQDSMHTETIQDFIQVALTQHATICAKDKSYGRLLLLFVQSLKQADDKEINFSEIEKLVEMHKSPFRRPCVNIVSELKSK